MQGSDRNLGPKKGDWILSCEGSLKSGVARNFGAEAREQGSGIFIPPISTETLQGAKQRRLEEDGAAYTKPQPSAS